MKAIVKEILGFFHVIDEDTDTTISVGGDRSEAEDIAEGHNTRNDWPAHSVMDSDGELTETGRALEADGKIETNREAMDDGHDFGEDIKPAEDPMGETDKGDLGDTELNAKQNASTQERRGELGKKESITAET